MILSSLRYFLEEILGRPKKQKSSLTINTARAKSPAPNTFNTLKQHILNNVFHLLQTISLHIGCGTKLLVFKYPNHTKIEKEQSKFLMKCFNSDVLN